MLVGDVVGRYTETCLEKAVVALCLVDGRLDADKTGLVGVDGGERHGWVRRADASEKGSGGKRRKPGVCEL